MGPSTSKVIGERLTVLLVVISNEKTRNFVIAVSKSCLCMDAVSDLMINSLNIKSASETTEKA